MNRKQVRSLIEEVGIIPSIRVPFPEDARFAAETVRHAGIPIVEISMTMPGAIQLISELAKSSNKTTVGAGSVMDAETARRCVDAGAQFITTDGLILDIVDYAAKAEFVVFPGALTPTEVITAWQAGSDFVKVFPCGVVGGENYLRALKAPLAHIPMIAAGGVNQQTAAGYLLAGAIALGVGEALFPIEAVIRRQSTRIRELTRRFMKFVENGRKEGAPRPSVLDLPVHAAGPKLVEVSGT